MAVSPTTGNVSYTLSVDVGGVVPLTDVKIIFGDPASADSVWLPGQVKLRLGKYTVTVLSPPNHWCSVAANATCTVPVYITVVPGQNFPIAGGYTYYNVSLLFPEAPFPLQGPAVKSKFDAVTHISVRSPSVGSWMTAAFVFSNPDLGSFTAPATVASATYELLVASLEMSSPPALLNTSVPHSAFQFMYSAAELGVAGVPIGAPITVVEFKVTQPPNENAFKVTLKCGSTNETELTEPLPQSVCPSRRSGRVKHWLTGVLGCV